jgi:AcrR family transcriptional regulator
MANVIRRTRLTADQRRERIVDAAIEVFAERGYEGASMRDIAAAAGISKPVLYDHFESKRELFVALMKEISGELTANTRAAMSGAGTPEERYRRAIDDFFAYVERRPSASRVLFVTPRADPDLMAAARKHQAGVTTDLAAILAADRSLLAGVRGRRRRLELATELVKTGINGLAEWWSERPEISRRELVEATMDVTWYGLGSRFDRR